MVFPRVLPMNKREIRRVMEKNVGTITKTKRYAAYLEPTR